MRFLKMLLQTYMMVTYVNVHKYVYCLVVHTWYYINSYTYSFHNNKNIITVLYQSFIDSFTFE